MTKPNSAELIFIVDRSGSMNSIRLDMEAGHRVFMEEQKKIPGECFVSLVMFDDKYEPVYTRVPLSEAPPLRLEPRGSTALLDAIGRTVTEAGIRLEKMRPENRPDRVLVIVITDGLENASSHYTREIVMEMIAHQREVYSWGFMFLGADQDAIGEANKLGISNALRYEAKTVGSTRSAYRATAASAGAFRSGDSLFNNEQFKAVYDSALVEESAVPKIIVNVPTIPGAVKPEEP